MVVFGMPDLCWLIFRFARLDLVASSFCIISTDAMARIGSLTLFLSESPFRIIKGGRWPYGTSASPKSTSTPRFLLTS